MADEKFKLKCRGYRSAIALCYSVLLIGGCQPPADTSAVDTKSSGDAASDPVASTSSSEKMFAHPTDPIRVATFNLSLNRQAPNALVEELKAGDSRQAQLLAEVIQKIRPDVLLLNEIDFDTEGKSVKLFCAKYLGVAQNNQQPIRYEFFYTNSVNTGVDSGMDLNRNDTLGEAEDAFGYGSFPGQYGMAVLSQFPIDARGVRTFQRFLWKDMPNAKLPREPDTGKPYYSEAVLNQFRLASKSVWDLPIRVKQRTLHLICAHPTPPVFDGPEDRNGTRNHDEIRFLADYIGGRGDYIYDDAGTRGGLATDATFVIVGDLNADPSDGESLEQAARLLTDNPRINHSRIPASRGAPQAADDSGGANLDHQGDPAFDTGDFSDNNVGNLRVDYVLPSQDLNISNCGVYWPSTRQPGYELNKASDHHLVWADLQFN